MRLKRVLSLTAVCLTVAAVTPPAAAENLTISIRDNVYQPDFRVIVPGDTVTWRNDGDAEHTVTAYGDTFEGSSDSSRCVPDPNPILGNDPDDCMDPGDRHSVRFSEEGTFEYYCKVHGNAAVRPDPGARGDQPCGMCGIIVVKEPKNTAPTSPSEDPTPTRRSSPTSSPSPEGSPSPSPNGNGEDPSGEGTVAAGDGGSGDGGIGRGAIALMSILALGGAGWWTWKRFLAPA